MRKCLVIELQTELLIVGLGLTEAVRPNHAGEGPISSSTSRTKGSNPRKYPLKEILCSHHLLKRTYFLGIFFKYLEAGCPFVFIFPLVKFLIWICRA